MSRPTVTCEEQGPAGDPHSIWICTDYHDGRGPQLNISIACGWGSYPEARARVLAEGRARAAQEFAAQQARWAPVGAVSENAAAAAALAARHPKVSATEAELLVLIQVMGYGRAEVPDRVVAEYVTARDSGRDGRSPCR